MRVESLRFNVNKSKKIIILFSSSTSQIFSRMILGAVFIYAGIDKICNPLEFSKVIDSYRLLPAELIHFTSVYLPWLEFLAGLFLITGLFVRASTIIIAALLGIFIIALVINAIRGIAGNCGCFTVVELSREGGIEKNGNIYALLRDVLFLIPTVIILLFRHARAK